MSPFGWAVLGIVAAFIALAVWSRRRGGPPPPPKGPPDASGPWFPY